MRPALLAVPVGIVLFLGGLWAGHRMAVAGEARHPELPVNSAAASSHDQDTARSIAALAEQIQGLREQIGARSSASETRVPADGSQSDLATLAQSIKELTERVESIRSSSRPASAGVISLRDPEKSPGLGSREELLREIDQAYGPGPLPPESPGSQAWFDAYYKANQRLERIHYLWSPQELIERYGRPDKIEECERGPIFHYTHTSPSDQVLGCIFYVRNGSVYSVEQYAGKP